MKRLILLIGIGCLASCTTTPYAEVGMGYRLNSNLYGTNPILHLEIGLQKGRYSCGIHHFSSPLSGQPFNNDWDAWGDSVICRVKLLK